VSQERRHAGIWWIALGAYLALILYVSTRPNLTPPVRFPMWDKLAHAGEYAIAGFLIHGVLRRTGRQTGGGLGWWRVLVFAMAGIALALADEWVQSHVPGRDATLLDAAADGVGLLIGMGVERWWQRCGGRIRWGRQTG
jgi:VanZ family protein